MVKGLKNSRKFSDSILFLESFLGFPWWKTGYLLSCFFTSYMFPHLHLSIFKPVGSSFGKGKELQLCLSYCSFLCLLVLGDTQTVGHESLQDNNHSLILLSPSDVVSCLSNHQSNQFQSLSHLHQFPALPNDYFHNFNWHVFWLCLFEESNCLSLCRFYSLHLFLSPLVWSLNQAFFFWINNCHKIGIFLHYTDFIFVSFIWRNCVTHFH